MAKVLKMPRSTKRKVKGSQESPVNDPHLAYDRYRPIGSRVLVKTIAPEHVSPGGILLPETTKDHRDLRSGIVIAIGDGHRTPDGSVIPIRLSVGELVYYPQYCGNEFKIDGVSHLVLTEADVVLAAAT